MLVQHGHTCETSPGWQSYSYHDIVLSHSNGGVCELLIADLEEAALLAGCAEAVKG